MFILHDTEVLNTSILKHEELILTSAYGLFHNRFARIIQSRIVLYNTLLLYNITQFVWGSVDTYS